MNHKQSGSQPDDEKLAREMDPTAPPVPARKHAADLDTTGSGAVLEPTLRMDQTESFIGEPTEKSGSPKDSLLQPVPKIAAPKEGQVIANRFLVKRLLGQGGMGRVYAVQDRQIEGRDVALKVLLPKYSKSVQFRKLFFQEVRAAQGFVSEYICQVRDTGETEDGSLFLTMDLIEGESLRSMLDREKILGPRHALEITRQVLLGLQSGHDKGFVHRDIKPPNVMLLAAVPKTDDNPYGVAARLLDFGIAGLASEIDERSRAGTVMYMSPEQASGERLDPRSDLFAVGVLLYEMLSGHRPFEGTSTRALVQSVLETNLTARLGEIPNLTKPVRRLLERALQKDRDKRFQSANEFAEAITSSAAYKLPKEVPQWAYAGLGVLLVAAGAEAYMLAQKNSEVRSLADQVQRATAEQLAAVGRAKEQMTADFRALEQKRDALALDRDAWQNKFDAAEAARIEVTSKYEVKLAEDTSRTDDKSQWDEQIEDLKGQLKSERDVKNDLSSRLTKLEDSEKAWRERAGAAERARDEAVRAASPQGQLAMTFDRVCDLIEQSLGQQALRALEIAQESGVFAKAGSDGRDFVTNLVGAAARMHKYREAIQNQQPPALRDIVEADQFLQSATRIAASFPLEAAGWIGFQFEGQANRDRPERARSLTELLQREVKAVLSTTQKDDVANAATIDLSSLGRDASAIFAHADRYGCKDHLSKAAERLVADLRSQVLPEGQLDLARLEKFSTLPEWVRRLQAAHFTLEASQASDLRALEFAQRWYRESDATAKFEWDFATPEVPREATSDWRQVMYLQWQLAHDNKNFPIKFGRSLLYRRTEPRQPFAWRSVKCKDASGMLLEYQEYGSQGFQDGTSYAREYAIVDGALRVKGTDVSVVDFHARGPNLSVVPFPIITEEFDVPPALASDAELRKFRKFVSSHPLACLAVKETTRVRWFSPEFGEVLEETPGGVRRELVSATGVQ